MKLLLNADVFGYRMTGLLGTNKTWFLGFSRALPPSEPTVGKGGLTAAVDQLSSYKPDGIVIRGPWVGKPHSGGQK